MRKGKWVWGTIAFLIVCIFVLLLMWLNLYHHLRNKPNPMGSSDNPQTDSEKSKIVARIGNQAIAYGQLMEQLQKRYGRELLNTMIDRAAIAQEGKALGISISEEEIGRELKRMQTGYENEAAFYKSMLEQLGLTKAEIHEDVYYKLLLERIATYNIKISDREVDEYIRSRPDEFRDYTQFHLGKIVVPTRELALILLKELQAGKDFSQLAKEHSKDEVNSVNGGDIGWIDADDPLVSPAIIAAAKTLDINQVSNPIPVESGYALIKLYEKKEVKRYSGSEVREVVRKEIALSRAVPLKELVKSLREKWNAAILDPQLK